MKINEQCKARKVAGEFIVVRQGKGGTDMTRIVSLNTTAMVLHEALFGREFTPGDAARVLMEAYGIDAGRAERGARLWIEAMERGGLLEDPAGNE